jgi:alkylation response protein AidB-like acyl-CoA dehydrogenase
MHDVYTLTDEQLALRDTVRQIARERVGPRAAQIDAVAAYPRDLQELFATHDLLSLPFAEEDGGTGTGALTLALAVEELAKQCASSAAILALQELGALPIARFGSEEQKRQLLPGCASGELTPGFALSEPDGEWDPAALATTAAADGDEWVIDGEKSWVTNLGLAAFNVVFARTGDGVSAFVVESDRAGVVLGPVEERLGLRGAPTGGLVLKSVRVPHTNLVGGEGMGAEIAAASMEAARRTLGAQSLGIATAATDYAAEYARERRQFGRAIASFDAIALKLGEMETACAAGRELLYRACAKADRGEPDAGKYAAMARLACSIAAERAAAEALQVLGGYGFVCDYPVERYLRDAKATQASQGGTDLQRLAVARSPR